MITNFLTKPKPVHLLRNPPNIRTAVADLSTGVIAPRPGGHGVCAGVRTNTQKKQDKQKGEAGKVRGGGS